MNPYLILAVVIAWGASVGGAFFYGDSTGADREIAKEKKVADVVAQSRDAMQRAAAEAIARIKPTYTTIKQETQHEIETHTVYRDCHVTPDGVRDANAALAGGSQPAGGGKLPAADGAH